MDNLRGISARQWWKLLRENRFAVDRVYWRRWVTVTMISISNAREKRVEDQRFGVAVEQAQVQAPIFILGHWRCGTTLLHELLALDEQFAYPNLFQVSNPHTFLTQEDIAAQYLEQAATQTRPMDNMQVTFRSPGEDEAALSVASLRSPVIAWAFPRHEEHYDRYYTFRGVPAEEIEQWKAALIWFLKKLTYRYNRPLVLKSPPHTGRIRLLLELFPDARFIHIHREPYTVFRSTQQLYAKGVPLSYLQRPDLDRIDEGIIRRYATMYEAFFEDRALIPAGQFCEIGFEDLERDIVGQVGAIYEQLRLPGFDTLRPKLQQYADSKAGFQKNRHQPLPDPLCDKIAQAWRRSFEEWNYAR
jgi:omega-hydroxy-beta-dihydromenaquinone-9 sulfotransferase